MPCSIESGLYRLQFIVIGDNSTLKKIVYVVTVCIVSNHIQDKNENIVKFRPVV